MLDNDDNNFLWGRRGPSVHMNYDTPAERNFLPEQGFLERSVQFDNQWMFDTSGDGVELTSATFTGDNIANISYRLDFSGGVQNGAFFLRNGGFFNANVDLFSQFIRNAKGQMPTIDFDALP